MEILSFLLIAVGLVIALVGGIWLLVVMFKESILWGLGGIFIPLVSLIFVVMHWEASSKPFLVSVGGTILYFIGFAISG